MPPLATEQAAMEPVCSWDCHSKELLQARCSSSRRGRRGTKGCQQQCCPLTLATSTSSWRLNCGLLAKAHSVVFTSCTHGGSGVWAG